MSILGIHSRKGDSGESARGILKTLPVMSVSCGNWKAFAGEAIPDLTFFSQDLIFEKCEQHEMHLTKQRGIN